MKPLRDVLQIIDGEVKPRYPWKDAPVERGWDAYLNDVLKAKAAQLETPSRADWELAQMKKRETS